MSVSEAAQILGREPPHDGLLPQAPTDVLGAGQPERASANVKLAQVGLGEVTDQQVGHLIAHDIMGWG